MEKQEKTKQKNKKILYTFAELIYREYVSCVWHPDVRIIALEDKENMKIPHITNRRTEMKKNFEKNKTKQNKTERMM